MFTDDYYIKQIHQYLHDIVIKNMKKNLKNKVDTVIFNCLIKFNMRFD